MPLGRSWILLGGLLPVDYDDLCLAELEPGRRFLERSSTLAFRVWQHERVVEPEGAGSCRVTDALGFELRAAIAWIPGAERLAAAIVGALFRHRHRRLARRRRRLAVKVMPRTATSSRVDPRRRPLASGNRQPAPVAHDLELRVAALPRR